MLSGEMLPATLARSANRLSLPIFARNVSSNTQIPGPATLSALDRARRAGTTPATLRCGRHVPASPHPPQGGAGGKTVWGSTADEIDDAIREHRNSSEHRR